MIFVKYKGPAVAGENLTLGKIYFGAPDMDTDDTVDFGFFDIVDDAGNTVRATVAEGKFEYLVQVYAVVVGSVAVGAKLAKLGEVVRVNAVTSDPGFVRVKGDGCWQASNFEILDKTSLFPDMVVLDLKTGCWVRVQSVNESMWVSTGEGFRPPTDYQFAVAHGSILVMPCVVCIDAEGQHLTKGRHYRLTRTSLVGSPLCAVVDDSGAEHEYLSERFRFV